MNLIILLPAMGKLSGRRGSLDLVRQPVWEKKDFPLKPVELRLKIDLLSHPTCEEGLVNFRIDGVL